LLFYNDSLKLLESLPLEMSEFDPRQRDWYEGAIGKATQITTDFYVFFTTGEVGVTFARRLTGGGGVLGVDLALDDLSAGLARQRVTPSTRIAMLDDEGRVFAHSIPRGDTSQEVVAEEGSIDLPHLGNMDDPVLRRLATQFGDAD
jgi:hypothetical protein